jgi:hypothetical protein
MLDIIGREVMVVGQNHSVDFFFHFTRLVMFDTKTIHY